jgi:catechol 2,3-dioxygenase-like lactoylglutathione lyase family enzyme
MIGYACIGTNDLGKARGYYDALFGSIGGSRLMEFPDEQGGFTLYGVSWAKPGVAVTTPYNKEPATAGNGNMIAIVMDSRDKVDAFHAKALELGGTDEGAPGLRTPAGDQAFYGAYFRDPEGNKFCAFRIGPES